MDDQNMVSKAEPDPLIGLVAAYGEKREDYFECERPEMLEFFPARSRRVLDVGCGAGAFGYALKKKFGCEVWGVESKLTAAEKASNRLDRVVHGYFGQGIELPLEHFECIFFNDVLEHMVDPASALKFARDLLSPTGRIVASIPNIVHFPTVWRLIVRGRWEYTEYGILDRTHLRFFTRRSIAQLFEEAGFSIELLRGINEFSELHTGDAALWKIYRIFSLWPARQIRDMRYLQFAVIAVSKSS